MTAHRNLTAGAVERYAQFRRLPQRTQRIVIAVGAASILIVASWGWYTHVHSPEYAFHVIDSINSRADLENCREYMTPQGRTVIAYAVDNAKSPSSSEKMQIQKSQILGTTCNIPYTHGDDVGYLQFQKNGVWQFDDVVITRHKRRTIELSVAWAIEHPILAALKVADWDELLENFIKGFLLGLAISA